MNVTMTHKQIPKDIYEDEHPYFTVPNAIPPSVPQSHNWDNKVGEVLVRVKRMEGILVKMSNALATKPQLPPKPTSDRRFSTSDTTVGSNLRSGSSEDQNPAPPPRPPRDPILKPGSKKSFHKTDCDFLQAQLLCVRGYMDSMIDDDFDDKREHMMAIDSVINALTFR